MKLARKKRQFPLIPLASMADIVFLLIIFFVLTSDFRKSLIKVEPPTDRLLQTQRKSKISVIIDKKGQLYLQGEEAHVISLESQVSPLLKQYNETLVMVKIDKSIKEKQFRPVLMALSKAGAQIALVGKKGK